MKDILLSQYYRYEFSDDSIEIKECEDKAAIVFSWVFFISFSIIFLCLSVFSFIFGFVSNGIIFSVIAIIIAIGGSLTVFCCSYQSKKRQNVFRLILNSDGVTHIDTDARYFIPWSEVKQFGFVNKRIHHKYTPEKCLYFSSEERDEELLKKFFSKISFRTDRHYSTNKMILFFSEEENIPERIYARLDKFIKEYCGEEKEQSYFDGAF